MFYCMKSPKSPLYTDQNRTTAHLSDLSRKTLLHKMKCTLTYTHSIFFLNLLIHEYFTVFFLTWFSSFQFSVHFAISAFWPGPLLAGCKTSPCDQCLLEKRKGATTPLSMYAQHCYGSRDHNNSLLLLWLQGKWHGVKDSCRLIQFLSLYAKLAAD